MADLRIYLSTDTSQTSVLLGQYIQSAATQAASYAGQAAQSAANAATSASNAASAATTVVNNLAVLKANNLSDVASPSTSLNNLGGLSLAAAASTYLTQANAASTYLTQSNAVSTYLTQSNASSIYLPSATAATTYAPLASPALTGTPTAPTPGNGTNNTQIATMAALRNMFASPAPIGSSIPNNASFTSVVASSTITPSQTSGIVGTTTNNNAQAGSVGEYLTASGSAVSPTSGIAFNATSISLTAGDWDVQGAVQYIPSSVSSASTLGAAINTTSATLGSVGSINIIQFAMSSPGANHLPTPMVRMSLSATTTIYLVGTATWSGGTFSVNSIIRARRVR